VDRSYRVLEARPSPSETELSFSGLTDLLEDVLADVLSELPPPQQRALGVALLRVDAGRVAPDARTIALAFRSCVTLLARRGPVIVAVDDVQWLDSPSAFVLEYAAQRLGGAPVGFLAARRVEHREPLPLALDRSLPATRLELGGLSVGALHELLRDRLGATFPRPVLLSIHETSAGSPLFALELARSVLSRGPQLDGPSTLPVPEELHDLLRDRLQELPEGARDALAILAAQPRPTTTGMAEDSLVEAVDAGIVVVEGREVRFTHPLLATVAYELAGRARRAEIHSALAEQANEIEERARHLALAAEEPHDRVAAALDEAAVHAAARGAPYAAAELAEMAARRTPVEQPDEQRRRRFDAATYLRAAADPVRVRTASEQLLRELPPGVFRARVLNLLAEVREDDLQLALGCAEQALGEAAQDPSVAARAEMMIGTVLLIQGDFERSLQHRHAAVELGERSGNRELLALLIAHAAHTENLLGRYTPGLLERGLRLEQEHEILLEYGPTFVAALRAMYGDRIDDARVGLERVKRAAIEAGDETNLSNVYLHLAELECRAGNLDEAERFASEGLERAEQSGLDHSEGALSYIRALIASMRGEEATTRQLAQRGLELVWPKGIFFVQLHSVLGFLELSLGEAAAALEHLRPLPAILDRMGYGDPSINRVLPNTIEALVQIGELDEARPLVEQLEESGRSLGSPWSLSTGARCRGLLLAGEGDTRGAIEAFERALVEHECLPGQFERGRTLLALGGAQRRLRRQRAARESLDGAARIFERVGTPLWAAKARDELGRIGGRAPQHDGQLSETERRIAELVVRGLSNKEVAASLFVTVRTVEANLTRIYAKLGIKRRTELSRFVTSS
jgi:DNA-binding CsgD family transcriptional regulator